MGLEAAWCASSPAPRVHGKSASDGSGCAGALVQCRGMRLLIRESQRPRPQRRIMGRPRGTLSRAGALAHRLARARRSATLSASIHGLRSCGVRSRCRSTSRRAVVPRSDEIGSRSPGAGIATPRQSKSTLSLRAIRRRGQYHPRGDEHFEGSEQSRRRPPAWRRKKGPPSSKALRPAVFDKAAIITGE